jgi:maltose alpha-D-glucosyltransferase/alpha-amylase
MPAEEAAGLGDAEFPLTLRRSLRDNTAVVFGESFIYKSFRRVEDGVNPDLEIGRALTAAGTPGIAPVAGYVEYRRRGAEPATLGILNRFVPNQGTAWQLTLDHLSAFFERVAALSRDNPPLPPGLPGGDARPSDEWHELTGGYVETVRVIARRTAELHLALGSVPGAAFTPEPFGKLYQRSVYQSMRNTAGRVCNRLAHERPELPPEARLLADGLLEAQAEMLRRFRGVLDPELGGSRIRCHGDYHLAQLLNTGKEFVVIDFEGESARAIGERRLKRSPLRDVASMVRSFDYALQCVFFELGSTRGRSPGHVRPEDRAVLGPWARAWFNEVSHAFAAEYTAAMADSGLLPPTEDRLRMFLELVILEKALLEIDQELTRRPEWLAVPLRGALRVLGCAPPDPEFYL